MHVLSGNATSADAAHAAPSPVSGSAGTLADGPSAGLHSSNHISTPDAADPQHQQAAASLSSEQPLPISQPELQQRDTAAAAATHTATDDTDARTSTTAGAAQEERAPAKQPALEQPAASTDASESKPVTGDIIGKDPEAEASAPAAEGILAPSHDIQASEQSKHKPLVQRHDETVVTAASRGDKPLPTQAGQSPRYGDVQQQQQQQQQAVTSASGKASDKGKSLEAGLRKRSRSSAAAAAPQAKDVEDGEVPNEMLSNDGQESNTAIADARAGEEEHVGAAAKHTRGERKAFRPKARGNNGADEGLSTD